MNCLHSGLYCPSREARHSREGGNPVKQKKRHSREGGGHRGK